MIEALHMEEKVVKLRGIQRIVAQKMTESHTIPRVTTIREVRMDRVMKARAEWNAAHPQNRASVMAFIIYGMLCGIRKYPTFAAHYEDGAMVFPAELGISVAVAVGDNLVTPVLHISEGMRFAELAGAFADLVDKARKNALKLADYKGGCMTVSNSGALGGDIFTPLINYPESSILGVGKIEKKVIVDDPEKENIIVCPMMHLCLTYDHRIINGSQAVGFLGEVDRFLQNPVLEGECE